MGLDAKLVMSLAYTFATGADLRLAEAAAYRRGLDIWALPLVGRRPQVYSRPGSDKDAGLWAPAVIADGVSS
jgi:hypothetical protein